MTDDGPVSPELEPKGTSCSVENHRIFMQINSDVTPTAKYFTKRFMTPGTSKIASLVTSVASNQN